MKAKQIVKKGVRFLMMYLAVFLVFLAISERMEKLEREEQRQNEANVLLKIDE